MKFIDPNHLQNVSDSIEAVESNTDAELVTVLAARSDDYLFIPMLWAAVLALLVPALLVASNFWLDTTEIFIAQTITFVLLALLFRLPVISIRLVPKSVRYWRASSLAKRQFLEQNLHHTKGETGVLIFISEAEHYVEIIADRGINDLVESTTWQEIVDTFITAIKNRQTEAGLIACIEACGEILAHHVPATEAKNELPNHLVVLE